MVSPHALGKAIRSSRNIAGLTQDELSDRAGLAYSTLAKIEQGAIKSPSFFTIQSLAQALDMSISEMLGEEKDSGVVTSKKPKESEIKFIYCDMNGVLVRFWHKAFTAISKETTCNLELVESTFWHYNDAANKGEITLREFNNAVAKHLGVETIDWRHYYMQSVKPIKVMQKCLEEIHGDVKIGLLTNTMPGFVKKLAEDGMLPDMKFDVIIDSSEVGLVKPSLEIYELAEKKAGYSGGEIMFIDDSRSNLIAAERLGWQVMWFDDYEPEISVRRLKQAIQNK